MGAFLIANFGIPEFLRSIPDDKGHSVSQDAVDAEMRNHFQ
jgi:hypothetical protein